MANSTGVEPVLSGRQPEVLPKHLESIFWRKLEGTIPYDFYIITVFKTDKHASLASFQNPADLSWVVYVSLNYLVKPVPLARKRTTIT